MIRLPGVLAALALAAALPAAARAGVPVALYPVQADELTDSERADVQAVVEGALQGADRRGVLEPRSPLVLPANCKAPITVGCVATMARGGVVLYARARRRGAQIQVTALFVDATGRRTRAVAFPVDTFIQNLRPAGDAIATLEGELAAGALEDPTPPPPPPALARGGEEVRSPPPAPDTPRDAADLRPPPPAPEREVAPTPPPPAGRDWRVGAGNWLTGSGMAMLVAGAAVGLTGMRLSDTLSDRYARGALRPEDARLYDRVALYEQVANGLFVAGGAVVAVGFTLHALAPSGGGAGVALSGSF